MDCTRHGNALREHALGAPLDPGLEAHLAACEACRARLASEHRLLLAIDTVLDQVRRAEPSPGFLERAGATALGDAGPFPRPRWLGGLAGRPGAAVAAAGLAVVLGVLVARWHRSIQPTPPATAPVGAPADAAPAAPADAAPAASESTPTVPPSAHTVAAPAARRPAGTAAGPSRWVRASHDRRAVIVPPDQQEALVRLAALVSTGTVAPPASLMDPPDPTRPLAPPAELSLPLLAFEPLGRESAENEGVMP